MAVEWAQWIMDASTTCICTSTQSIHPWMDGCLPFPFLNAPKRHLLLKQTNEAHDVKKNSSICHHFNTTHITSYTHELAEASRPDGSMREGLGQTALHMLVNCPS